MTARAEASERLANQIISGVSSGLLVVDRDGIVQIVNPSARRILNLDAGGEGRPVTQLLAHVALLAQAITDTLESALPVARRRIRFRRTHTSSVGRNRRKPRSDNWSWTICSDRLRVQRTCQRGGGDKVATVVSSEIC